MNGDSLESRRAGRCQESLTVVGRLAGRAPPVWRHFYAANQPLAPAQLPPSLPRGSARSVFAYDEGNERYFEKHVEAGKITRIWKLGKLFEYSETTEAGVTTQEEKHYVTTVAQHSYKPAQNGRVACSQWRYFHGDRLGSIETVTNATGQVIERHGFDPFGKPRQANWMLDSTRDGMPASQKGLFSRISSRGFTGHDHIDSVGLIHMNGRAYDPELGRFTGVDPFVTKPLNAQSLNPYSYVSNNPIMGTDPTGYREEAAFGAGLALAQHLSNGRFDGQAVVDAEIAAGTPGAQAIAGGFEGAQSVLVSVSEIRSASAEGLAVGAVVKKGLEKAIEKLGDRKGRHNNGKQDQQSAKAKTAESTDKIGSPASRSKEDVISENAAKGKDYADKSFAEDKKNMPNAEKEITVKTNGEGIKLRLDCVGNCAQTGDVKVKEYKSSEAAPLTKNQGPGFKDMAKNGATVVGEGKGDFKGGTEIPPTKAEVQRPSCVKTDNNTC